MTTQQIGFASVDEWIAREGISFSSDALKGEVGLMYANAFTASLVLSPARHRKTRAAKDRAVGSSLAPENNNKRQLK